MNSRYVFLILSSIWFIPLLVQAELPEEKSHDQAGAKLEKRGSARYRYFGFSLYDASFFSSCQPKKPEWDSDCKYQLKLDYLRTFTPEDFIESSEKMMKRVDEQGYYEIEDEFNLFKEYFREVNEGDSYLLSYSPEKGMTLSLNGELLGKPTSKKFAKAYFYIWLSEDGIDDDNSEKLWGVVAQDD